MADNAGIIKLYTELAKNPNKDFGWEKGLENAKAHGYKKEWIEKIPIQIWEFCAAVGNPFKNAEIKKGETVVDLGCGAGVDILVASLLVGKSGSVYGIDITPKMVEIATIHAKEANVENVKILESSFDKIPLEDTSVDVVISNGAINLASCKESVFAEIYRILKPDGKIFFADIIDTSVDEESCCSIEKSSCCDSNNKEDWANCVAGTMRENELVELIQNAGFSAVKCLEHTHYMTSKTTQGATFKATKIEPEILRNNHWESVFKRVNYTQVLWHQNSPQKSLDFINIYALKESRIIDVGCGASLLVDELLKESYQNITLLDTSKTALDIVAKRVNSDKLSFIYDDVLNLQSKKKFNIWHDRAVFHFLLTKKEQKKYFHTLTQNLQNNAIAIISTFGIDGPTECSNLRIVQYNAESLQNILPSNLQLLKSEEYIHQTPKKITQKYIYFILKKI